MHPAPAGGTCVQGSPTQAAAPVWCACSSTGNPFDPPSQGGPRPPGAASHPTSDDRTPAGSSRCGASPAGARGRLPDPSSLSFACSDFIMIHSHLVTASGLGQAVVGVQSTEQVQFKGCTSHAESLQAFVHRAGFGGPTGACQAWCSLTVWAPQKRCCCQSRCGRWRRSEPPGPPVLPPAPGPTGRPPLGLAAVPAAALAALPLPQVQALVPAW